MKKDDKNPPKIEVKLDFKNLPELPKTPGFTLPKAPPVTLDDKHKPVLSDFKDKKEFSLIESTQKQLETYGGRFRH